MIGTSILGLIGCKSTKEITDEEIYEFEHRCKECHNEMTELYEDGYFCLYTDCINFTDPQDIYEIYPDSEHCFYCNRTEGDRNNTNDTIKPYIIEGKAIYLCDETASGCMTKYKYAHNLPLTPDGDIVYCEECGNQVDPMEEENRDLACCYKDIDNDGDYEYFHVGCYLTYTRLQPSRDLLEYEHDEEEALEDKEAGKYVNAPCDYCGMHNPSIYGSVIKWYSTDGCCNYTHEYCIEFYTEETGKEPVQDLPNLE